MEENVAILNVPYRMITVDSMGKKSIQILYIILSSIIVCLAITMHITFFVVDFTESGEMTILDHIGYGLCLGGLFCLFTFIAICNLKKSIRIYKNHKVIDLFIVTMGDSHQLGLLPDNMYICFTDIRGIIIGYKEDEQYIDDFIDSKRLGYYDFIEIYEKQNKEYNESEGDK